MRTIQLILLQILFFFAGMIFSSLLITHSNTWKLTLPLFIILLVIKVGIYDFEKKYKNK